MIARILTFVALSVTGFSLALADEDGAKPPPIKRPAPTPLATTVKGTITLHPSTGKPAGAGEIQVTLSRRGSATPSGEWIPITSQTIAVKPGETLTGPWHYSMTVMLPSYPEKKTAPTPALPVMVSARYLGPWSVSTGGGPVRANSPVFNVKVGQVNIVNLVLKAEIIH